MMTNSRLQDNVQQAVDQIVGLVNPLNINIRKKPMPCDFLVVTATNLKRNQNRPGLIYSEILKHGKEIYAA